MTVWRLWKYARCRIKIMLRPQFAVSIYTSFVSFNSFSNTHMHIYLYMHREHPICVIMICVTCERSRSAKSSHTRSVCQSAQSALYTPKTHMQTRKGSHTHSCVKDELNTHTHTHASTCATHTHWVVESPWHWLPPISAASLLVQVAATMTTMQR